MTRFFFRWVVFTIFLQSWSVAPVLADPPTVHTNRVSPVILPLPKGDDVFHFIVFGDRTGGPQSGIKVLEQAVQDTNLLDPDLVMTVGDLVQGYNQTDSWLRQMEEFRSVMNGLKMPWFPVAGNHDIYWRRDPNNPEDKPPREHEESYEKHFGPLWYWFEHKQVGFLVLFSDEGHPDGRPRSFSDPQQQQLSNEQMSWLADSLREMKDLQHVFVFLHHPLWWNGRYPGNNWDDVHKLLVEAGNVRAVLAGHVHVMTYSGLRDGIDYYSLATTGGSLPKEMEGKQYFGYLHHFNVVTVRKDGYKMASLPVGGVFDPKQFDELRQKDGDLVRSLHHHAASPPIDVALDGSATAIYKVAVDNPCSLPLDITMTGRGNNQWIIAPDHRHGKVEPGERIEFEFACVRQATEDLEGYQPPEFEMTFDVLTPGLRIAMPARTLRAATRLHPVEAQWPSATEDRVVALMGGNSCLRVDAALWTAPTGPFTIEAHVKPLGTATGSMLSNRKSNSGFGLEVHETPAFTLHTDQGVFVAKSPEPLTPDAWSHVAGVYDGSTLALFVNGRRVASTQATGAPQVSKYPLYVGAMPGSNWVLYDYPYPAAFWSGAIDEIRLSHGARYADDFKPAEQWSVDSSTIFQIDNDQQFGRFVPVAGARPFQAELEGRAQLVQP